LSTYIYEVYDYPSDLYQSQTNPRKQQENARLWKGSITNHKVRYLPEIWRQDAAGASLEQANAGEKEERQRERPRKRRKNNGLIYFRWVILKFFSFPLKILVTIAPNNCYAKLWFWVKFAPFQLSTYYPAATNCGFFHDFRKCDFKSQSANAPRFAISFKITDYFCK
jgi:hypothetical protein